MKRVLLVVLVIAVIAAGWLIYSNTLQAEPTVPEGIATEPVSRGDIEATISAVGSLAAERTQSLSFTASGQVIEVLVEEGQEITEGQVLARLDDADLQLSIKQAEAALRSAEASLEKVKKGPSEEDLAAARAAVDAARANLEKLQKGPSARDIQLAKLNIDQAKNTLWGAQGNRDAIKGSPVAGGGQVAQAEAQVANAELAVKIAEINYAKLVEPADPAAIAAAQSQLTQAESSLARLESQPTPEDIRVAEAQVEQAQVNVDVARSRLDNTELTAPLTGQLAAWKLHAGDVAAPGTPIGTIMDTTRYHIDVSIDETDIRQIQEGSAVRIELDAFPGEQLTGQVARVSLVGDATQGIVTYNVRIDLQPTELPARPLMTAAITVVTATKENVLIAPNRAILRDAGGKYVEELRNGTPTKIYITTGLTGADYTEIVDGLEEGQEIIVSRPRESIFSASPFGG